uniref:Uncharacterized protein n=1 Tax=Nicotiana tabacum TaxID=4097 RepID=A0A1S3ZSF9_TOBAC|nr:PREDICTED: uncharacterized protein LOC107789920 [Nicotiana tabacum]
MAHDTDEKKSENEGESRKEKESEAENKLGEQVEDSGEKEKDSEEECDSEGDDEEVNSDEDELPLSKVGKNIKKAPMKTTKSVIPARKEVAPPTQTHLIRSKRKAIDEKIIKESRGAKKPRKKALIVELVVELDEGNKFYSTLKADTSTKEEGC